MFATIFDAEQQRLGFAELRLEPDGVVSLLASNAMRRVLVNYYFALERRVVIVEVDGVRVEGGLRTRKRAHERAWWIVLTRPGVTAHLLSSSTALP